MKKFLYSIAYSFLSVIFCSKAMDQDRPISRLIEAKAALAKFQKKIPFWDDKKITFSDAKLPLSIPKNLIITPDEKGVVVSSRGIVNYINFSHSEGEPFTLIKHIHKAYCPMVAVAMQGNRLVVVSVLNSKKNEQKAQCVISYNEIIRGNSSSHNIFGNRWYEDKEIDSSVQAVTLSSDGNILAIASSDSIHVFDLQEFSSCSKKFFMPRIRKETDNIIDVSEAISVTSDSNERHIAAVNTHGVIDFKRISKKDNDISVHNIKDVKTGDFIEKIHLFKTQELMYVTTNGEVKIIDPTDWLEHFQGNIRDRIVSHHENAKAAVDQGLNPGTIHWVDNSDFSENIRFKIYVHRESSTSVEDFEVSIPDNIAKTYSCITVTGQKVSRPMHILTAALRGNSVAALLADGSMYLWHLPKKYQQPTEFTAKNPLSIMQKDNQSALKASPSSPSISSLTLANKTRKRSSTADEGEKKQDRNSIKVSRSKDKNNGGSKEFFKSSSSPRKEGLENQYRKRRSKDNVDHMDTLREDTFNDFERSNKK